MSEFSFLFSFDVVFFHGNYMQNSQMSQTGDERPDKEEMVEN